MARRKINPEVLAKVEAWQAARHPTLEVGEFTITSGDIITVALPSGSNRVNRQVEFVAYVAHDGKAPYVEVKEAEKGDNALSRCVRVEDIKKVGRKKVQ